MECLFSGSTALNISSLLRSKTYGLHTPEKKRVFTGDYLAPVQELENNCYQKTILLCYHT